MLNKRFFNNILTTFLLLTVFCCHAGDYQVLVLGDLHYDRMEYHDLSQDPPKFHYNSAEVKRNLPNSEKFQPQMLTTAAQVAPKAKLVIQTGDFTQGDCGSEKLQKEMYAGAMAMLKKYFPKTPVYFTVGNHDLRGPGAGKASRSFVPAAMSRESGGKITSMQYSIRQGKDVYIFIKSTDGNVDLKYLQGELKKYKNCRYRFVVGHYPILPIPTSSICVFDTKEKQRQKLWDMLGKANAIVLCGHIHRTALLEYKHKTGKISELVAFSLLSPDLRKPDQTFRGQKAYSKNIKNARNHKLMKKMLPGIKEFFFIRNPGGYVVLNVGNKKVTADFYLNWQDKPFASACLRNNKQL